MELEWTQIEQPQSQLPAERPRKLHVSRNKEKPREEFCTLGMRVFEPRTSISEGQEGPAGTLVIFLIVFVPIRLAQEWNSYKTCQDSSPGKE